MQRTLVIVESPAKAKTIGRYLGKKYRIAASVGHIRDLPSSVMGVDVKNNYAPQYIPMQGKNKIIKELQELAADSQSVLIATDPDREGEAIGWHIATVLKIDPSTTCRISFNEITQAAVTAAVEHARPLDMNLVNAQQARRILDRLVGYELSPLLWNKIKKGLSAGRVQSATVKLIIDREQEIESFKPEEYWNLTAEFKQSSSEISFKSKYYGILKNQKPSKQSISNEEEKDLVLAQIHSEIPKVYSVRKGNRKKTPLPPFTTSTMQQEASKILGFTSKKTMSIAQQLYEGIDLSEMGQTALITYMRTDSVRSSPEAISEIRAIIQDRFGESYLPKTPRIFKNKKNTQDGHEAVRPAHFDLSPDMVRKFLSNDQYRLYRLIWNRFIASQMADASIDSVVVDIIMGKHVFRSSGDTVIFAGHMAAWGKEDISNTESADSDRQEDMRVPELKTNEILFCVNLQTEQKFTLPPPRYTEASLIKLLEEKGIGRPSTYAPTISTILERKYIEKDGKNLFPTSLGKVVNALLEENFKEIVDPYFTADMEKKLDRVEDGEYDWIALLKAFYPMFHEKVVDAGKRVEKITLEDRTIPYPCPECGGVLIEKDGRFGKFIACKNFPQCKYTKNVDEKVKGVCPLCGSGLIAKRSKKHNGNKFFLCDKQGKDPSCPFISWSVPLENKFCEVCGGYMVLKRFRSKSYPQCGNKDCPSNVKRKTANKDTRDQ